MAITQRDHSLGRDRVTEMCLVPNDARPSGTGQIHLAYLNAMGYVLYYAHVVHPNAPS